MGKSSKIIVSGTVLGLLAGAAAVASNEKARHNVSRAANTSTSQIKELVTLVKENREAVMKNLQSSGNQISDIMDRASQDVKQLVDTSQKMKGHLDEVRSVLYNVGGEWKELIDEASQKTKHLDMKQGEVPIKNIPEQGEGTEKI
ncbi:hypothetical protein [Alkalicoccus daliensis]|uniref:Gas vesicle protein n=1 Tax=Alkalicoccus daliensis TaxID=745820 RepID=A0A1H0DVG4_9BACI|nr:hypothetical protein [Alkalicoccus daliensis]SDN74247.1 hypothetical protein SAMN04488053_103104 [Alkalicoccus daliensis]